MVQPLVARQFLQDANAADSGLLARFLICKPVTTIGTRMYQHEPVSKEALEVFHAKLKAILLLPMPMDERSGALSPRVLPLSEGAKAALVKYADRIEVAQADGKALEHIRGAALKSAEQAARFAGVLVAFEDINAHEVSLRHIEQGIRLAEYYLREALRLSQVVRLAEQLRQWLFDKWDKDIVTPRDIQQSGPNAIRGSLETIRRALSVLAEAGWIVQLPAWDRNRRQHP